MEFDTGQLDSQDDSDVVIVNVSESSDNHLSHEGMKCDQDGSNPTSGDGDGVPEPEAEEEICQKMVVRLL